MALFVRRTYIEPGAVMPLEVTLSAGRLLGITAGNGSLPSLMIWQEIDASTPMGESPDGTDDWEVWVLRHGNRAPRAPVSHPWDWEGVVTYNRQPAVVFMHKRLTPRPDKRERAFTADVIIDDTRPAPVNPDPFGVREAAPARNRGGGGW